MTRKTTGLGKGLDALIPGVSQKEQLLSPVELPISIIKPNPRQPRVNMARDEITSLAESIKEFGIIQPLIVTREGKSSDQIGIDQSEESDSFILIAGERRLIAAKQSGLTKVPVVIREATQQELLELALVENIQRTDLSPIETAEAYRHLNEEFKMTHSDISLRVGKSRVSITNTLRLLKLDLIIQQGIIEGAISEGHARALLGLPGGKAQVAAFNSILKNQLSVRETEELVRSFSGMPPKSRKRRTIDPDIKILEERIRSHLGTKVNVRQGKNGGTITIHYYSDEELEALINKFMGDIQI